MAGRSLAGQSAAQLAAPVLTALADTVTGSASGSAPTVVREVVIGNCMGQGGNVARVAALQAGLPALTLDQQCASGLVTISLAATDLRGDAGIVLAGGVESEPTAPWRFWPPAVGGEPVRYGRAPLTPAALGDPDMGPAADALAEDYAVTRAEQDAYAARSHARAMATLAAGGFQAEIVPIAGVNRDDRPRAGLTAPGCGRRSRPAAPSPPGIRAASKTAPPLWRSPTPARTADSACQAYGSSPRPLVGSTRLGPGLGIVPAARLALQRAGLTLDHMDVIEVNGAFAGQILACCRALALEPQRVCREGGALALGHPWGASGAVLGVRLFTQLVTRPAGRYGLAPIAAGGGQGVAMVVETLRGAGLRP